MHTHKNASSPFCSIWFELKNAHCFESGRENISMLGWMATAKRALLLSTIDPKENTVKTVIFQYCDTHMRACVCLCGVHANNLFYFSFQLIETGWESGFFGRTEKSASFHEI